MVGSRIQNFTSLGSRYVPKENKLNWLTFVNFDPSLKETSLEGTRYSAGSTRIWNLSISFITIRNWSFSEAGSGSEAPTPARTNYSMLELSLVTRKKCFRILFIFANIVGDGRDGIPNKIN